MIVNVKDKDHVESYIRNKFYHIPAKRLSNVRLGVEYIAFYKSEKAFSNDAGISCYAKIKEIRRYKRKYCLELPVKRSNEDEEYLRIELEDIINISNIKPVEYGIQLISYTTLYLLKNAENVHELKMKSRYDIKLYKLLKSISKLKGCSLVREKDGYKLNNDKIELLNYKKIRVNGVIKTFKELEKIFI